MSVIVWPVWYAINVTLEYYVSTLDVQVCQSRETLNLFSKSHKIRCTRSKSLTEGAHEVCGIKLSSCFKTILFCRFQYYITEVYAMWITLSFTCKQFLKWMIELDKPKGLWIHCLLALRILMPSCTLVQLHIWSKFTYLGQQKYAL